MFFLNNILRSKLWRLHRVFFFNLCLLHIGECLKEISNEGECLILFCLVEGANKKCMRFGCVKEDESIDISNMPVNDKREDLAGGTEPNI